MISDEKMREVLVRTPAYLKKPISLEIGFLYSGGDDPVRSDGKPATFPPLRAGRTNQIFKELLAFSLFKLSFSPHR